MFQSGMKEAQEGKVEIKDFSFEIVEAAVKFCYHQSLVTYISLEDKIKVLQFFDKYDIQSLKVDLENGFITEISQLTISRLTNAALLSNSAKLKMKCTEFLEKCLRERKPIADFDLLDKDFAMNLLKKAFYPVSQ